MGDRGNIVFKMEPADVWLYTHWCGTELAATLHTALSKRWRWRDDSYLARIVFCEMIKGQEDAETSYGIATSPPDNEHNILRVDCEKQEVSLYVYNMSDKAGEVFIREPRQTWTFDAYVASKPELLTEALNEPIRIV